MAGLAQAAALRRWDSTVNWALQQGRVRDGKAGTGLGVTSVDMSQRLLPLPALVREALKGFRATQAAEKLAAGEAYSGSGYVIVDELGAALNGRQLRVRAYKIMDKNGFRRVRLYDARASCLTYLANSGVPDHILARWVGHTSVKTTKKWYVKPDVEDLRPAAEAWGGLASVATPSSEKL
ncbi:tyrosine-type recombinase/integrase [Streptomyces sp. NPDC000880]